MNNILIILGMHRSGTSLVSGWLKKCHLNLGDRLLKADEFNKDGYFEDLDFLILHEEILSYYNIPSTGLVPPFNFELSEYYYKKLKSNVEFKNSLNEQWGWKEPRTCLFIDLYKSLLPNAKYLIVYRDYKAVVFSLFRRDYKELSYKYNNFDIHAKLTNEKYFEDELNKLDLLINIHLKAWILYNQNILDLIKFKDDYIIVTYNKLVENDRMVFEGLEKWGFKLKYSSFSLFFNQALINESLPEIFFDKHLESQAIEINTKMNMLLNNDS